MKKLRILLFCCLLIPAQTVLSGSFQINFDGELESLTTYGVPGVGTIDSIFTIGDTVNGRIIVDADNISTPTVSLFEITIGSYTASGSGKAFARNDNQAGSAAPILDSIVISSYTNISSNPIGEFSIDRLQFAVGTGNLSILSDSSPVGPTEIMALWNDTPNYFSGNLNYMSFGNGLGEDETARFALTSVSVAALVDLDIKPGSDRNPVNLKSNGKLPVVVYGSAELDVSTIDQATLLLNGVALSEKNNGSLFTSLEDEDGDGILDLVMHFILQDLGIEAGMEELLFTGSFLDGRALAGSDVISIVGSGDANGDGVVSAADYASVQANFGGVGDFGDANGDGVVSAGDYASVQANFGNIASAQVIPEPASLSLLALGGLAMVRRKRK